MNITSCATNLLIAFSSIIVLLTIFPVSSNMGIFLKKIKKFDVKEAFSCNPLIPVLTPALAILIIMISVSVNKELSINNHRLISYKQCESKELSPKIVVQKEIKSCSLIASN